ncbi:MULTISPECIES: LysR family transcriptional regulator [Thalassospira]|jgi:DNA-binding transcriptional LysR family regulator|uniref:LysR family transcriptional regulator n=1 Tax=Thalassospira xiamenensis TaxID=220697 RepID=A0A367XJ31_9PROT|nr:MULTISPECIES: LysR family transcriptional regulator [Thalassospira]KZB57389.1 LysR family transcriptional regulator [Thalassospira xiamenensis]MBO9505896.1 LysR family transcriptional regulator [Thalassospira sp. A3_1]RCK29105.1 LysR family transcriptional regulator [Thalassospira xiamenensis]RCK52732.1 LysR family transcriptional regulator [Thalassospira xiamenensis]
MDRFQAMRIFVRVVEAQSFAAAARELGSSPPAVTRAVAFLEEITGARLLTRTTRSVTLTEPGANYYDDCKRLLADLEEAEAAAGGAYARPSGTLTITAPVLFGQMYIFPVMTEFLDLYPEVRGRVLLFDRIVNIVEEGIDLAIRIGHMADTSMSAIKVGTVRRIICGSPDYFARCGRPQGPADIGAHRVVASTGSSAPLDWQFGGDQNIRLSVNARLQTNSIEAARKAAIDGWGLVRMLSYQAVPFIENGSLEVVLSDYEPEPLPIHIVHPEGRHAPAKVRAFIDLAVDRLRSDRRIN